jgi:histidinol-phosphate/aromatic aminotransferase/cobyric acid decarboxylase-like protein
VKELAGTRLDSLQRYPDPADREQATSLLATAIGVAPERLLLTNGAAEAIALVAAQHPIGWVEPHEFSLYARHLERVERGAPRWRSNPNNPLGMLAAGDERAGVWDESFWPLATGTWTRGDEDAYRIGSLTKLWHCPGLRLGYVIAPDAPSAAALAGRQPAWSVNSLALALVEPLLALTDLPSWQADIASQRRELAALFAGFQVRPSAANWLLVHDVPGLRAALLEQRVLVRDCASFGLPGTIRMAVPRPVDGERVAGAVAAATASYHRRP